ALHAKRILEGVAKQCAKYDYDVVVFASMVHFSIGHKDFVKGEENIYELINFDLLDGVIVDCISFIEEGNERIKDYIEEKLKKECNKPVVSLSMPLLDYDVIADDDEPVFRQIVDHVVNVHKLSNIYFLTGHKGYNVAEERVALFKKIMGENGLEVKDEQVFYGDFWYSSGTSLADKIISGEVPKPEAVVCASDHMAIGLINRLHENGIRIPEDILVTGFEATQEAAINSLSVTSFESNMVKVAADAVDVIRSKIDPKAPVEPFDCSAKNYLHAGMSCGCDPDFIHSASAFKDSFYFLCYDWGREDIFDNIDIGLLMEGYVAEQFSAVETPEECMEKICSLGYLICSKASFYLCLKENWLDLEDETVSGYPDKMKMVVMRTPDEKEHFAEDDKGIVFDTELMLPRMLEEREEPNVFFFSAVHFQEKMLGYAVLQHGLDQKQKAGVVYRNWLRNVNNSLELVRAKNRLRTLSIYDEMTGAYNRRGMDLVLPKLLEGAKEGDKLFAAVIDMDGLKYVNDNYGHGEGDYGIKAVCNCVMKVAEPGEICIRAGGDEFYILGVGKYKEADLKKRRRLFEACVEQADKSSGKPYLIAASLGCAIAEIDGKLQINSIIDMADVEMYKSKVERKKQRM
ncbi:MAG: GGDEF domain-containing protein, partial [Lachnospiraceae bacterium]|nr:GGDEF domain-containing protein [Lachnospiraceae bacterium]